MYPTNKIKCENKFGSALIKPVFLSSSKLEVKHERKFVKVKTPNLVRKGDILKNIKIYLFYKSNVLFKSQYKVGNLKKRRSVKVRGVPIS